MSSCKFYCQKYCPFAQRAWIALLEKNVDFEYVETNPYEKTPEWLAISPKGQVPVLVHDGHHIYESQVLLEYIEDAWPGLRPSLLPAKPADRARCRVWCDHIAKKIVPPFYQILMKPDQYDEGSKAFLSAMEEWVNAMDKNGPYFNGSDNPDMVDMMLFPFSQRIEPVLTHYRKFSLPAAGVSAVWTRYDKWFKAMAARPAVEKTTPDREGLIEVYKRYV